MSIIKIILLALKIDSQRAYVRGVKLGLDCLEHDVNANGYRIDFYEPEKKKLDEMDAELKRLYEESPLPGFYVWLKGMLK